MVLHYESFNWSNNFLKLLMRDKNGLGARIYDANIPHAINKVRGLWLLKKKKTEYDSNGSGGSYYESLWMVWSRDNQK